MALQDWKHQEIRTQSPHCVLYNFSGQILWLLLLVPPCMSNSTMLKKNFIHSKHFLPVGFLTAFAHCSLVEIWYNHSPQKFRDILQLFRNISPRSVNVVLAWISQIEDRKPIWQIRKMQKGCQQLHCTILPRHSTALQKEKCLRLNIFCSRQFRCSWHANILDQGHYDYVQVLWVWRWRRKCDFVIRVMGHRWHWYGLSPVWVRRCSFRWLFNMKHLPQWQHWKGRSPVCSIWWVLRFVRTSVE